MTNEDYIVDARQAYNKTQNNQGLREAAPETKEEIYNKFFFIADKDNKEGYRELNNIIPGGNLEKGELDFIRMNQRQLSLIEYIQDKLDLNLSKSAIFFDRKIKFIPHSSKGKAGFAIRSLNKQEVVQQESVRQKSLQEMGQANNESEWKQKVKHWLNKSTSGDPGSGSYGYPDDNKGNKEYEGFW